MPGYHLPYLAAAADGLFARHDLQVEILEPAPGPENIRRVAAGGADMCLTSVAHYLRARAQYGPLAARFVAVLVRRNPIAALVTASSALREPADLGGRSVGGHPDNKLVLEYCAALADLAIKAPVIVPMDYGDAPAALGRGAVDVVADFIDLIPRTRLQAGVPVRGIQVGGDTYASGLVAADRVPAAVVRRMRAAVAETLERQRQQPDTGLADFIAEHPELNPDDVVEGWELGVPGIFAGSVPVGDMDASAWERTLRRTAAAHALPEIPSGSAYRPEFLAGAVGAHA